MRARLTLLAVLVAADLGASEIDVARARQFYNQGQYDNAITAATEARKDAATAHAGALVLGRAHLERFRQTTDQADLSAAREALRSVDPSALAAADRVELMIGLAEALFLEEAFGAAGELFENVLDRASEVGVAARERVLDWWATSLDRQARRRPSAERVAPYDRILDRMRAELTREPGSAAAGYWLVAAARGRGDLERAWHAALAGWVRSPLARDRGAALRADLDRLVRQAIIPERARRLADTPDGVQAATAAMLAEWELMKTKWTNPE